MSTIVKVDSLNKSSNEKFQKNIIEIQLSPITISLEQPSTYNMKGKQFSINFLFKIFPPILLSINQYSIYLILSGFFLQGKIISTKENSVSGNFLANQFSILFENSFLVIIKTMLLSIVFFDIKKNSQLVVVIWWLNFPLFFITRK